MAFKKELPRWLPSKAEAGGGGGGLLRGGSSSSSHGVLTILHLSLYRIPSFLIRRCTLTRLFLLMVATMFVTMNIFVNSRGYSSVLVPIYLGELAPPTLRGMLGTLTQFALVIGILFADLLAFPFATESSWRVLFAVTLMISMLQLLCSPFLLGVF